VLIEACSVANAYMQVNYTNSYITFYSKDSIKFSGYRYRPEINLKSLDVTYSGEDIATILYVSGGTDEYDRIITLVPSFPTAIKK
jgi:hypothetical protein